MRRITTNLGKRLSDIGGTRFELLTLIFLNITFLLIVLGYWITHYNDSGKTVYYVLLLFYLIVVVPQFFKFGLHKRILNTSQFLVMKDMGFVIENKKEYWGYKGTYRDYFIRVFYDQHSGAYGAPELWVTLYYKTPYNKSEREVKDYLYSKYENVRQFYILLNRVYFITVDEISVTRHEAFARFWSFKKIADRLDFLVDLAKQETLEPMSEDEVNKLIELNPGYAPSNHYDDFS